MMLKKSELTIYLTSKCNLGCKHCYRPDGNRELSPDDLNWILDNIENKRTTFLGGEPMLYPHLKDCIEAFPQITISTNAQLINEKNVGILNGVNGIQMSVEMGKKETDYLRGPGVWDKVMETKKLLEKEGIEYYLRASFWQGNLNHLQEFIKLDMPLVLFPRIDKSALPERETSALFEEVLKHDNWILALPNFLQYLQKPGRCKAGSERINILYNKKITPCNFDLDYHLGRIGDDTALIDKNIQHFLDTTKKIPSECIGCKNVDICRGSCYASHVSAGCPLRYNFSIQDYMGRYNIDADTMKQQTEKMTNFMRKMLVC